MIGKIKQFLGHDVWRIRATSLPRSKSIFLTVIRTFLVALRGFSEDKCKLQASALTFFTLLSIVPIVAMAFGIAKGFGFEGMLERKLMENFQGQEEVIARVIEFARNMLEKTSGGLVAGIGIAILFWTVIKVLGNIEESFNTIWGIKKGRSLARKFSDYLAIMLICPVLFIVSSSLNVFITSQIELITEKIAILGAISGFIFFCLKFLPFAFLWALFSMIYIVMPNTKVSIASGLFGGIIGGTIYQVVQWIYITFQIGASKYGAIYGSFAALPLFLFWLQLSWLVVLFGAELSFAHQNVNTYEFEPDCLATSNRFKKITALVIMHKLVHQFCEHKKPLTSKDLSDELDIPFRLLNELLFELTNARLLTETKTEDAKETGYQLACDSETITINFVLHALDTCGTNNIPVCTNDTFESLEEKYATIEKSMAEGKGNVTLRSIPI